jgi:hypothetical protein
MNETIQTNFENLWSLDRETQYKAFLYMLDATDEPVEWAYEVWDTCLANLKHSDNHYRAIAAQILCNLAKSDPQNRMLKDFSAVLAVTKDERFVTARHCLQALWKIGAAGKDQQELLLKGLAGRYMECAAEKNCTLICFDIIQCLRNLYDQVRDEDIKAEALELIEIETDLKYCKKYARLWK